VEFTGEPICAEPNVSVNSDYCNISETCSISVPVSEGINAVQQTSNSTSCYRYYGYPEQGSAEDTLQCQCNGPNVYKNYLVSGIPATSACLELQLCSDEPSVVLPEPTCMVTNESTSNSYCDLQRECSQTAETADGVTIDVTQYEYANCSFSNGEATCSCQGGVRNLYFGMDIGSTAEACGDAIAVCQTEDDIVPEGEITCSTASQSSGQGYCSASIDCAQDAVVNGTTISVHASMNASCTPDGDAYACSCSSNVASASLQVEADTEWDACSQAATECPELIDIDVSSGSPYGYGYSIPL
jgi:hypothetical protein